MDADADLLRQQGIEPAPQGGVVAEHPEGSEDRHDGKQHDVTIASHGDGIQGQQQAGDAAVLVKES